MGARCPLATQHWADASTRFTSSYSSQFNNYPNHSQINAQYADAYCFGSSVTNCGIWSYWGGSSWVTDNAAVATSCGGGGDTGSGAGGLRVTNLQSASNGERTVLDESNNVNGKTVFQRGDNYLFYTAQGTFFADFAGQGHDWSSAWCVY